MSTRYNARIVSDKLMLHLDAANTKSYIGSGTAWNDLSGNGHNATLVNGVGYSSNDGGSLTFDGSNDHASFTSLSLPNRPFTVGTWCRYDDLSGWQMVAGQDQNQDSNSLGAFYFGKSTNGYIGDGRTSNSFGTTIYGGTGASQINVNTPNAISANTWYNFVVVFSSSDIKLYMNSSLETTVSDSTSIATRTGTFRIGGAYYNNNLIDYFDGRIANLKVYDRELTATEVKQNYDALRGRFGL